MSTRTLRTFGDRCVSRYTMPLVLLLHLPGAVPAQNPTAAREHYNAARRHGEAGRIEPAIEEYRMAIAAAPREWLYSYHLGELLLNQTNRWSEALEAFEAAWDKGYQRGITRHAIGRVLVRMERPGEALAEFERAIALNRAALDTARSDAAHLRFQLADSHVWLARLRLERHDGEAAYQSAVAALDYDSHRDYRGAILGLGHIAFGAENYDLAARLYALSLRDPATGEPLRDLAWDDYPDWRIPTSTLLEVVENRRRLGQVQPEYVHRVLVLVIRSQDVETDEEGRHVHVQQVITDRQRREAEARMRWLRQVVESLSDGRLSLSFELVDDTTAYRYQGEARPDWVGDRRILAPRINEFDTLVRCWPWGQGEGTGGATSLSLEPVNRIRTTRGIMNIHPEHSYGMWLHEFFHVVEAMADISPTHGYYDEPRRQFPGWTGPKNSQLDYFRWHFRTTLPRLGWSNLNFRLRYPVSTPQN